MPNIRTKSAVRAYDSGDVFFDIEYDIDDPETGVFIATVKVTVPLDDKDRRSMSKLKAEGADRARQILSELLAE